MVIGLLKSVFSVFLPTLGVYMTDPSIST